MIVIAAFLILRASAIETPTTTNFLSYTFLSPTATFTVSVQTQPSSDVTPTGTITFTDQDENLLTDENNNNPVILDNGRAIFTMSNLVNGVQNIKAKYQSDGVDDFTVSDATIPVCRTASCFKKEDSEQVWTRIYHCDNANNGYETEIDQVKALALTASQILITPDPTSSYGITSKPHTFPIKRMRLGQNLAYPFSDPNSISISNIATYWDQYGLNNFDFLSGRLCTNKPTVSAANVLLTDSLYEVCDNTLRLRPKSGECMWGYGLSSQTASVYINGPVEIPADSPVTISLTSSQTVLDGSTQLSIVFTAIVSSINNPDSTPNGAIVFQMDGISLTGGILSANQIIEENKQLKVTYTIEESLLIGEHTIQAVYVGDYSSQQSDGFPINYATSTAVATTCDLTVDSIIRYGDTLTFTSTISPSKVLGRVKYKFNSNFLPSTSEIQNGIATYTFKNGENPIIGLNTITASYLGVENHFSLCEKSKTVTEKRALTTLALSLKQEQSSFYIYKTIEIYVTFTSTQPAYSSPDFTFTGVKFYTLLQDNTRISDFEYKYLYLLEFQSAELHKLKVNYAGDNSYNLDSSISNEMSFNVEPAPTTVTFTFTPSLNAAVGAPVSFVTTANCKGTMTIKIDGQQVRQERVDVGGTSVGNLKLSAGDHEIVVDYSGDTGYCAASTGTKILKVRPACTSYTSLCSNANRFPCIQSLYDEGKCGNCLINYTSSKEGPAQETDICTAVSLPTNPPVVTTIQTSLSLQFDCSDFNENQQYYFAGEFITVDQEITYEQIQLDNIKCEEEGQKTIVTFTIKPSVKPNGLSAATILKKLSEQLNDANSGAMRSYLLKTATVGQDIVTNALSNQMVRCKGGFAVNLDSCPSRQSQVILQNSCRPPIVYGQTCLSAYVQFSDEELYSTNYNIPSQIPFKDGTTIIRNQALQNYKFSVGTHTVSAFYEENDWVYGSISTPITFTVTKATPTILLQSARPNPAEVLESVAFSAQVSLWDFDGKVQLFDGNTFLSSMFSMSYGLYVGYVNNLTISNTHSITARCVATATKNGAISNKVLQKVIRTVPSFATYTSVAQGKLKTLTVTNKFVGGTAKLISKIFSDTFNSYSFAPSTKSVSSIQIVAKSAITITIPDIDGYTSTLIYANQWPAGNYLFKTKITLRSKNSLVLTKVVKIGQQYSLQVPTGKTFSGILSLETGTMVIQWTGPTTAKTNLIYTLAIPGGSRN